MSFSAFADGSNYNIVPDSPYISGLQVKDNDTGEFIIKRPARASSASSTSSDSVYYFKDIVNWKLVVIPNPDNLPNVIKIITENGHRGYQFQQKSDDFYEKYNSFRIDGKSLPNLRSTNKYHVTFTIKQSHNWGAYHFYLYDSVDPTRFISLAKKDFSTNIGLNTSFDFSNFLFSSALSLILITPLIPFLLITAGIPKYIPS